MNCTLQIIETTNECPLFIPKVLCCVCFLVFYFCILLLFSMNKNKKNKNNKTKRLSEPTDERTNEGTKRNFMAVRMCL